MTSYYDVINYTCLFINMGRKGQEITPDKKTVIIDIYLNGSKPSEISKLLDIPYSTVFNIIKKSKPVDQWNIRPEVVDHDCDRQGIQASHRHRCAKARTDARVNAHTHTHASNEPAEHRTHLTLARRFVRSNARWNIRWYA